MFDKAIPLQVTVQVRLSYTTHPLKYIIKFCMKLLSVIVMMQKAAIGERKVKKFDFGRRRGCFDSFIAAAIENSAN